MRTCYYCGISIEGRAKQARTCSLSCKASAKYYRKREQILAKSRAKPNPTTAENRAKMLRFHYGMSVIQWLALFTHQGERCAVCKTTEPGGRGWQTDHCHRTNKVRGILCMTCNVGIGKLGDTSTSVLRAARYLQERELYEPRHA